MNEEKKKKPNLQISFHEFEYQTDAGFVTEHIQKLKKKEEK